MAKVVKPSVINPNKMSIVERFKAPTPKFFKTLRTIGLALAGVGGVILASPFALPAGLITIAGYVALAGGVATAISQAAVDTDTKNDLNNEAP